MVVSTAHRKLTYEDYLWIPEDGNRHEILDGVHVVTASPFVRHQRLSVRLTLDLGNFIRSGDLGELLVAPMDTLLSRHDVVQPDLLFISKARRGIVREKNVKGAPDLVIEILSPGTRKRDLGLKRERYEQLGVGEYWALDPEHRSAEIFRRSSRDSAHFDLPILLSAEAGDRLASPQLPGLEIELRDLFAD